MTWQNSGIHREDIVGGVTKKRLSVLQPSGARFNEANHNDTAVYIDGQEVDALVAYYHDIPNEAGASNPPLNGRLGEFLSVTDALAAPTAGTGTLETIVAVPRGRKMVIANSINQSVAEWDGRTGRTLAQGVSLGTNQDFSVALQAIETALETQEGLVESASGTRILPGGDQIVDATLIPWIIEADTKRVLRNGLWAGAGSVTATQLLYLSDVVYRASGGRWYSWDGSTWVDEGVADPENPTPSIDWYTVPDDGAFLIGDDGVTYERGAQAGAGYQLLENGQDLGGWCLQIKIGDGAAPRTVYHSNPLGLGWIYRDGTTWSQPGPDPEGGSVTPVSGTTRGSIAAGSAVLTVQSITGFAQYDYVIVEPASGEGLGPGGAWPPNIYANASLRNASLGSHPDGTHVGQLDNGNVYIKSGGLWILASTFAGGRFYQTRIRAIALMARIEQINGNQFTLSRTCSTSITDAVVHWAGAKRLHDALNNAANGTAGNETAVNANTLFPGRTAVALDGIINPDSKSYVKLTCNSRDSILFYSPKGTPSCSFVWTNCTGCIDELVGKRGNWTPTDFGMGFQGNTVAGPGGYIGSIPNVSSIYPAGTDWRSCTNCEQRDQTVTDVPIRAAGGESVNNCWARRVKNVQTKELRDYVQWQMQWASYTDCGFEDCEIDSYALIAGFELFIGTWSGTAGRKPGIIRPKGRNATIAINNAGGWDLFRDPNNPTAGTGELRFTAGCVIPLEPYPSYGQYANGVFALWVNHNVGTYNVAQGGSITDAVIVQEGYADSQSRNFGAIKVSDYLPNVRINGASVSGPATRVAGIGMVGLQTDTTNQQPLRVARLVVQGEAQNQANNYNIFVVNGIDEGGNICNPGGKSFNWVIT